MDESNSALKSNLSLSTVRGKQAVAISLGRDKGGLEAAGGERGKEKCWYLIGILNSAHVLKGELARLALNPDVWYEKVKGRRASGFT